MGVYKYIDISLFLILNKNKILKKTNNLMLLSFKLYLELSKQTKKDLLTHKWSKFFMEWEVEDWVDSWWLKTTKICDLKTMKSTHCHANAFEKFMLVVWPNFTWLQQAQIRALWAKTKYFHWAEMHHFPFEYLRLMLIVYFYVFSTVMKWNKRRNQNWSRAFVPNLPWIFCAMRTLLLQTTTMTNHDQ